MWFAIVAIALLTGCMHDEILSPIPEMEEQAIGFATGTNAVTRGDGKADNSSATEKYGLSNYHDNFSVWGYKFANSSFRTVFEKQLVTWDGSVWDYTPHRYWDKTVKYYNFYACAPVDDGWTVSNSTVDDMTEGTRLIFSYSNYTADGKSLAQSTKEPTSSEKSLFATDISKNNADLMIAHDAIRQNENRLNNAISFEFDHILSRLNIALKKSDEMKEAGAVVKLTELKIVNLMNKGNFNEDLTAPNPDLTADELKAGTNKRWTASIKNTAGIGVTFDSDGKVTGNSPYFGTATPTNTIGDDYLYVYQGLVVPQKIKYVAYNIRGTDTTMDEAYLKIGYTIDGETFTRYYNLAEVFSQVNDPYTVNGRTAYKTDKSKTSAAYAWRDTDGKFYADANTGTTAYDNKEVAYQVEEQTTGGTTTTYWLNYFAADTETDDAKKKTQIYKIGNEFYEIDNGDASNKLSTQPKVVVMIADNALVPVLRKEISDLCDVTFCEGWQYNLKMTIGPKAIRFNVSIEAWGKGTDQVFNID